MTDARIRSDDDAARMLAAIVESSDDAIIAKDLDGTILSWNRGAERMYGYRAEEAIRRPIFLIVPPPYVSELSSILERIRAGERVRNLETLRVSKDGRLIDVTLSISPIRNAAGTIVGASAIARDITERRREVQALKDSEARLRSVLESAVDGIVVIDARGRIETFNPAAERLFGYHAAEAIAQNVNMLMPSPYHDEHDQDASCRIAVTDSGPGIPPEVRARLFTPFVTTKSRGTGLGLSTVKRLVEAHGGEIRVDCPPEGGTTVVISLPVPTA